jgi:4-hydroxybenzoate polyprenyltransferase
MEHGKIIVNRHIIHLNGFSHHFRALAASARLANVPSVAGNVFLGVALATSSGGLGAVEALCIPLALLVLSGVFLYLAGNFLNDWADRGWDEIHRRERALPSGLFTPRTYFLAACAFGLLGICSAAAVHPQCLVVALIIVVAIVIYTWTHKWAAWSVIPMGSCRALLPVLGFAGFAAPQGFSIALIACAFGLFFHIVGLSLSARGESIATAPTGLLRFARWLFLPAALLMFFAAWVGLACPLDVSLLGVFPYVLWIALCLTIFRKPVHRLISNLLAGIPLVDWIVLLPLALVAAAPGTLAIACLIGSPCAFLAGKALQRLAPAT